MDTFLDSEAVYATQKWSNVKDGDYEMDSDSESIATVGTIETNTSMMDESIDKSIFDVTDMDWEMITTETPNIKKNIQNQDECDTIDVLETCFAEDLKNLMLPANNATRVKYAKWVKVYMKYVKENCLEHPNIPFTEHNVCRFFHDGLRSNSFGLGSIWTIYSCLNSFAK